MKKTTKLQIVCFCGFLRVIYVLLRFFCARFVCGLEHLGINRPNIAIQRTKVQYTFAIRGRVVGPCLNGEAGEQKQTHTCTCIYNVCVCLNELHSMLASPVHVDLTLSVIP